MLVKHVSFMQETAVCTPHVIQQLCTYFSACAVTCWTAKKLNKTRVSFLVSISPSQYRRSPRWEHFQLRSGLVSEPCSLVLYLYLTRLGRAASWSQAELSLSALVCLSSVEFCVSGLLYPSKHINSLRSPHPRRIRSSDLFMRADIVPTDSFC